MMEKLEHQYGADALSEALEVSESGFAAHRGKQNDQRWKEDAELRVLIAQSFEESRKTYGSPRVRLDLRELGHRCGKNRVARLMWESGLRARQKRGFRPRTTESRHSHEIAENWLAKLPAPDRPGQLWQSDITYIETQEGWLSLYGSGQQNISRTPFAAYAAVQAFYTSTTHMGGPLYGQPVLGARFKPDVASPWCG